MAELKEFLSRIKFVYRRTSNITKLIVTVAIILCMTTLIALRFSTALENRIEDLRNKAGMLEEENSELEQKIDELGSVKSVVEIAEEELGLVDPDTVLIDPE